MRYYLIVFLKWLLAKVQLPTTADPVLDAVKEAYGYVGLDLSKFAPDFNLAKSGKLLGVLYRAASTLDVDHQLTTVSDVVAILKKAK